MILDLSSYSLSASLKNKKLGSIDIRKDDQTVKRGEKFIGNKVDK